MLWFAVNHKGCTSQKVKKGMGEFEEWLERKKKRKQEGQTGPLERTNLIVLKVQFNTRHKSMISLRDIRRVVEEAKKEFPDYSHVEDKHLSETEFTNLLVKQNRERWDWFHKWFGEG